MRNYITNFLDETREVILTVEPEEIARALKILQATYERDGRIYIFGNGGSLALATHFVSDLNKTVFSQDLNRSIKKFQALRVPSNESELTAWANDIGYDMVFAGPLQNYLSDNDCVVAISSSGNSTNIIKAVEVAKLRHIPVIGLSGFDGGKLALLADAKIVVKTEKGRYDFVESIHSVILHLITSYFQDYFNHLAVKNSGK
ncbi:MAG: SIS domain-containing protein [Candidatus Paceibacterota bacterium]|jgi:D-sedoheptulose 7-phosphate isomerase